MNSKEITAIYVRAYGPNPKFAIRRKIGPFQEQYDVYSPWDKIDIIKELVRLLDREFSGFLEHFSMIDAQHHKKSPQRTRHYISKNIDSLYPNKDINFCKQHSYPYKGYWIGTNIGSKQIVQYVQEMCETCNINCGSWNEIKF